jgi:hypothetical protein
MPAVGDLVRGSDAKWMVRLPQHCANGRTLGPNQVLAGHVACLGHGGGHTTWTCRAWDETVYGPPLNTHCTTLDGPATVRIWCTTGWPDGPGHPQFAELMKRFAAEGKALRARAL